MVKTSQDVVSHMVMVNVCVKLVENGALKVIVVMELVLAQILTLLILNISVFVFVYIIVLPRTKISSLSYFKCKRILK